ncbi:MAG TPA: hypothetical protein VLF93_03215 [Candidatus Saccharimonadales bacterium]|nr:hypothetical protein [Candidatus Saccharimonadales bacterium]
MAAKLPKSTNINRPIYNAFDSLEDDKDKLYVDMAVHGYSYRSIAFKAKREHQTVKSWFTRNGRLYEAYKYRMKEHREEYAKQFKRIDQLVKDGAVDAVLKLNEAVRAKGAWPSQITAAKDLLSRAGFDYVQKIDTSITHKTDSAIVEAALKALAEDD